MSSQLRTYLSDKPLWPIDDHKPRTIPACAPAWDGPLAAFNALKPNGRWYGIDHSWLRYQGGRPSERYEYLVDLAGTPVRSLSSRQDVEAFSETFGAARVDWQAVAAKMPGLELLIYDQGTLERFPWCRSWECACGVTWRPSNAARYTFRRVVAPGDLVIPDYE